jgi:hypothetical protein
MKENSGLFEERLLTRVLNQRERKVDKTEKVE